MLTFWSTHLQVATAQHLLSHMKVARYRPGTQSEQVQGKDRKAGGHPVPAWRRENVISQVGTYKIQHSRESAGAGSCKSSHY